MKTKIMIAFLALLMTSAYAQEPVKKKEKEKIYSTAGGEFIFSFANTNTDLEQTKVRFSAWYHTQVNFHYDFGKHFGVFTGIGTRNIGYVSKPESNNIFVKGLSVQSQDAQGNTFYELNGDYKSGDELTLVKRRTYTVSVPLGFKIGLVKKNRFLFMGGEVELPFHYKAKAWVDGEKVHKDREWFSEQTNPYLLSAFVGIQFSEGTNLKFKWYFNDLMNKDYTYNGHKPYANLDSQMFYISFGMNMNKVSDSLKDIKDSF
jgi:hypothetical protein